MPLSCYMLALISSTGFTTVMPSPFETEPAAAGLEPLESVDMLSLGMIACVVICCLICVWKVFGLIVRFRDVGDFFVSW